ncbi:S-DNA-T family DNA segregation ATPase FtsK/SpoIIIE [Kibdelosporangium banguiense]|uniref:S-DNA-T family DNA segregation ATPase FtsK/SpoIIIE n=1 Tax=Kibdelosporangium banguiense TaxID=1365924 RepID=A0ABS4TH99_9PSEU|nr:FtsK/SpoIIIE domain-containing protein [Kibdelosporangium banguiense]MBP2323806.1 S-DNA-T family DNA segregation ATPase FtsK/SpoIIIE [Kibdelosporangium banguiense]
MNASPRDDRTGDDMGELVPFPCPSTAPASSTGTTLIASANEFDTSGPVVGAELLTDVEQHQRVNAHRWTELVAAIVPARWQNRDHHNHVRAELVLRAVRVPLRYPVAVARGSVTAARAWWAWVSVRDFYDAAKQAQQLAQRFQDIQRYRVRRRWSTLGVLVVGGAGLLVTGMVVGPIVWWATAAPVSVALAVAGRRKDGSPGRKNVFPGTRTLAWTINGDVLVEAFQAAKVIGPKDGLAFFLRPRRDGDGWAVIIDLPAGRKASSAIAARESLASALGVDETQLILERVRGTGGHAGRVAVWVADTDPLAQPPLRSYLEDLPGLSIWDGVTIGATARGKVVTVAFCWTAWLIAGLPRYGKSNLLRLFLVAACLDPHTRIYAVDLKDGADFNPLRPVAHRLLIASAEGAETEETLLRLLALLIELESEVLDRYKRFKDMPEADVPEGKITRDLVAAGMPWLVLAIDECQLAFEELGSDTKQVKDLRRVIVDKVSWLVRKGPAAGATVLLATQKPDRGAIPTRLRDNISSRAALRLPTQQSNDMALGTGKGAAGVDATKFTERHRGAAWLLADDLSGVGASEGVIIRAAKLDLAPTRAAAEAGRERRVALGLLTGDAAGHHPPAPVEGATLTELVAASGAGAEPVDAESVESVESEAARPMPEVLELLADVLGEDETGIVATADLAQRIGWDPKALGEALRRLDIPAPRPPRQRIGGSKHPVSAQSIDAIIAAIVEHDGK